MGGNALKNTTTRRYEKKEYEELLDYVKTKLRGHPLFSNRRMEAVQAYKAKESFGDLDLLVESDGLPHTVWFAIQELFKPNDFVRNGSVTSFDVNELQVDLLLTHSSIYDMSSAYFAYNDLGNLMGRIAYKMGLRYGHEGLGYHVYSQDKGDMLLDTVILTKDPEKAMAFLGYDVDKWKKGFVGIEDIFEFTASTPYFHADFYDLDKRTYKARVRDAKRPTYQKFLEWLSLHDYPMGDASPDFKEEHLARARAFFPSFQQDVNSVYARQSLQAESKARLNAHIISDWLCIPIEQVGAWFKEFKKLWPTETEFHLWAATTDIVELQELVRAKKGLPLPGPSIWNQKNVQAWTGLKGAQLSELCTRFPQQWLRPSEFYAWVSTQNEESIKRELQCHMPLFNLSAPNSCVPPSYTLS